MLHGPIQVNGMTIGEWEATRQSHLDVEPLPDDVVEYAGMVRTDSTPDGRPATLWRGTVPHRFGDGMLALMWSTLSRAVAAERRGESTGT